MMAKQYNYLNELNIQVKLTVPIIFAQLSMMAMGFVDMVMTGAVSPVDMAAVALGSSVWFPLILFGQAVLQALHPTIAQLQGEGKFLQTGHVLRQGMWLALLLSIPLSLIVYFFSFQLDKFGMDLWLAEFSKQYLHAIVWGTPGFLLFVAIRCYFEGIGCTRPAMIAGFCGLAMNIPLNYMLIFGKFGCSAYGGVGAGIATAIVYWFMFVIILCYALIAKEIRKFLDWKEWREWINFHTIYTLVCIGFPGAFGSFFELTTFAVIALLIAPLGVIIVAGHEIALSFSAIIFMIPFSLGITAAIRTGYGLGMQSYELVYLVRRVALSIGLGVAVITAITTCFFRYEIARIYNQDPEVINVATTLLLFAAIYQFAEAVQAISMGILKGYKDTKMIFYITFVAYWLVTIPMGYTLGRTNWIIEPMGVKGFWLSVVVGLSIVAVLGIVRVKILEHRLYNKLV